MSTATYLLGILAGVVALVAVVELLRRRRLRERHAAWWSIAALAALVIGVFPGTLTWVAEVIGVEVPTNLIFFVSIVILFFVNLQHAGELTDLEDRARTLAEEVALQRVRLERLERGADPGPDREDQTPE